MELAAGARVDIHGLVGAAQYNGCEGRVMQGPNDKGRWEVQVDFQCEERTVSLKPENLQPKPSCGWELAAMSLQYSATEREVSEAFATCGMVRTARLTKNPDGSSKGICIVEMAHRSGAEAALEKLQGHMLRLRAMKVEWSLRAKQEFEMGTDKEADDAKKPQAQPQPSETSAGVEPTPAADPPADADVTAAPPAADATAGSQETEPAKPQTEEGASQRRRRSAWDQENSGGVVYTAPPASGGASTADEPKTPPLPPEEELSAMPAKELRRLLSDRGVNVSTCFEKSDLLEQARLLSKASS